MKIATTATRTLQTAASLLCEHEQLDSCGNRVLNAVRIASCRTVITISAARR